MGTLSEFKIRESSKNYFYFFGLKIEKSLKKLIHIFQYESYIFEEQIKWNSHERIEKEIF